MSDDALSVLLSPQVQNTCPATLCNDAAKQGLVNATPAAMQTVTNSVHVV